MNFDVMSEADVREEIITPFLRRLGYGSGLSSSIRREVSLTYPREVLGRRKRSDPLLRGIADYICEAESLVRWVIEAKSPKCDLGSQVDEQAFSYARHPEIRGVYYLLCNGRRFELHDPARAPEASQVMAWSYEWMEENWERVMDRLSPEAILRDFPGRQPSSSLEIGPGLRSPLRILGGYLIYRSQELRQVKMDGLYNSIIGGVIDRDDDGCLAAQIRTQAHHLEMQEANTDMGLDVQEFRSADVSLSVDVDNPTCFTSRTHHILPKGRGIITMPDLCRLDLPYDLDVSTYTEAKCVLAGRELSGSYSSTLNYRNLSVIIRLTGEFLVHLG